MSALHDHKSTSSSKVEIELWANEIEMDGLIKHSFFLCATKRLIDIVVALIFFFFFGWLYVLLWIGVIISSGSPAMYAQPRFGRKGKVFKFYKFRSMVTNADEVVKEYLSNNPVARQQWNDFQKLENDPRITRFGNFIRKTSLDELPQFWNVLKGDMSIIGPRPCMVSQCSLYEESWNYYCSVRPGITGLWQVSGRNKLSYQQRVQLDVKYVLSMSLLNDAKIALRTVWVVISGHGSR